MSWKDRAKLVSETSPDWKSRSKSFSEDQSVVGSVKEALRSSSRNLLEDITGRGEGPIRQAKTLPALAGTTLSAMGVPGGMTVGTTGGRQLSNAALIAYGRPEEMPSGESQAAEAALSVLGDVTAIPAINKRIFGSQIGRIEKARGVPSAQDIPSIPMATGQKTLSEFIDDAVRSVKDSGGKGIPSYWLTLKDQVDRIYQLGKDQALTRLDQGKLKFLNGAIQSGINRAVPGRAAPAAALAESQRIPNAIGRNFRSLPKSVRTGLGIGSGTATGGGLAYALGKYLVGNRDRE